MYFIGYLEGRGEAEFGKANLLFIILAKDSDENLDEFPVKLEPD